MNKNPSPEEIYNVVTDIHNKVLGKRDFVKWEDIENYSFKQSVIELSNNFTQEKFDEIFDSDLYDKYWLRKVKEELFFKPTFLGYLKDE